jgi:hypothetical protein
MILCFSGGFSEQQNADLRKALWLLWIGLCGMAVCFSLVLGKFFRDRHNG